MPVPKFNLPKHKPSERDLKRDIVFRKLYDMNYNVLDERHAIHIIENNNIDKTQFDWPYGSFEAFKQHVLASATWVSIAATFKCFINVLAALRPPTRPNDTTPQLPFGRYFSANA